MLLTGTTEISKVTTPLSVGGSGCGVGDRPSNWGSLVYLLSMHGREPILC